MLLFSSFEPVGLRAELVAIGNTTRVRLPAFFLESLRYEAFNRPISSIQQLNWVVYINIGMDRLRIPG